MAADRLVLHASLAEQLSSTVVEEFKRLSAGAKDLLSDAKAPATRRAYQQDWADFASWCVAMGRESLPANTETVTAYVRYCYEQNQRGKTIGRMISALVFVHKAKAIPWKEQKETALQVLSGLRRRRAGTEQVTKKDPMTPRLLRRVVSALSGRDDNPIADARDRALILVGWTGAFRRSELVATDVKDLERQPDGSIVIKVGKSKTDQEGKGATKVLPIAGDPELCAVAALDLWLNAAEIDTGPVFRGVTDVGTVRKGRLTDRSAAEIIKRALRRAGFSEDFVKKYSGHSLRSGFITEARRAGKPDHEIMAQTQHKSREMLDEYTHIIDQVRTSAARGLL